MSHRTRLTVSMALIAISLLILSACGTTSAATLTAPTDAGAAKSSAQTLALAGVPQQPLQTQGVTQTIILTPLGEPPVQQQQVQPEQNVTPVYRGKDQGQIPVTPTVDTSGRKPAVTQPGQSMQPVYPPAPVYPPQPAYPPISVPPVQVPVTIDAPGVLGLHIVQPGDTLYCIGRAYQVDPIAIAQANSISGYAVIVPGHALLIPATKWTNIPAGPICHPQFAVDWNQPSATSVTAVPLCGYVAFNYPAPQTGGEQFNSTETPLLVSTGSFANGYAETFAITVTGRRPDAIMAFTANTPVCIGASRPQTGTVPQASTVAVPFAATSGPAQTPPPHLSAADVLTDPNTLNLVIDFELIGAAAQRYGPSTSISFAIDPSIAPNATHYFRAKYRSSALAYLTANAGGITGALYKNCQMTGPSQALVAGQFNLSPLSSWGSAYYALMVIGRSGVYGFNGYNVAGTWGNLEATTAPVSGCP
jgi:LysM repeat protein